MTWQADAAGRYGAIGAGLMIGTAARYGLALSEGRRLSWRAMLGDALLLGLVGLFAVIISDKFDLHGDVRAFCSALAAVSSDRLIKLLRSRFMRAAEAQLDQFTRASIAGDVVKVPAGSGAPDNVRIDVIRDENPIGSALRSQYRRPAQSRPPEDQIELLRKLDQQD
ncbi:hypothetical protein [Sphingomonas nostoxanthinifaciens]|uniref:hypothetical protein n=1 Tax=Sphingomonas nostoxanthinifaciens TaxID=2872652 RepID=UPI001CC1FA11|nr:hypothetical protein [Sphingomonas nostoxanthinifaciens]UAK24335.1 hypothetical protein K8P63_18815 [Sphingomonas nostoxanthinifaciens]